MQGARVSLSGRNLMGAVGIVAIVLGGATVSLSTSVPGTADEAAAGNPEPATATEPAAAAVTGAASPLPLQVPAGADALVLGDSLAVALYPYLAPELPDRRVTYAAQEGRSTAWAATRLREELRRGAVPPVLVVSSGTNDGDDAGTFRLNAERLLERAGTDRCVVWLTVHVPRPEARNAINDVIADLAGRDNVAVADWAGAVEQQPGLLIADRVHATPTGLQVRARLVADAVHRCSPHDPDARSPAYVPPPTGTRIEPARSQPFSAPTPQPTAETGPTAPSTSEPSSPESPTSEPSPLPSSGDPQPSGTEPSDPPPGTDGPKPPSAGATSG